MMRAYKFTIPAAGYRHLPDEPNVAFAGCAAVAIAESAMMAQREIAAYAKVNGFDARWLVVADVAEFPITSPRVISFVMF